MVATRVGALRVGATLLVAAVATVALAPAAGTSTIVPLSVGVTHTTYETLAVAEAPELVRHVAALIADAFDVPLPPHVVLGVYPTRTAFADALVRDVGVARSAAVEVAATAIGLALPRMVFLLAGDADDDRVRLVAHEVMHLVQHEVAGPRTRPAQWLMEGSAEWAALTLLDRLGATGVEARRQVARTAAQAYLTAQPRFTLEMARRPGDFRRWQHAAGTLVPYQVAYVMTEYLVALRGAAALMDYFRAFRDDDDLGRNFERAFGTSTGEFTRGARAAIARSSAQPPS